MATVFVSHPSDKLDTYFGGLAAAALQCFAEIRLNPHARDLSTAELIVAAQGCDALIAYRQTPAPQALFTALPDLVVLLRCAVDIRTIDVEAASAHGVLVTRASAGYGPAVSEWVLGAMIDLARGITLQASAYRGGEVPMPAIGRELRYATLGIIGFGLIGQGVAALALAFGMRLLVTTPQPVDEHVAVQQVPLATLLARSDFVVCLAPADAQTESMMNAQAFAAMKQGAFFINASRGELVDDAALLAALDSGRLGGCALDVGRGPDQTPAAALARHPRVIATAHIGGLTRPACEHQALETVEQLRQLLHGDLPRGAVNAAQATRLQRWGHAVVLP